MKWIGCWAIDVMYSVRETGVPMKPKSQRINKQIFNGNWRLQNIASRRQSQLIWSRKKENVAVQQNNSTDSHTM